MKRFKEGKTKRLLAKTLAFSMLLTQMSGSIGNISVYADGLDTEESADVTVSSNGKKVSLEISGAELTAAVETALHEGQLTDLEELRAVSGNLRTEEAWRELLSEGTLYTVPVLSEETQDALSADEVEVRFYVQKDSAKKAEKAQKELVLYGENTELSGLLAEFADTRMSSLDNAFVADDGADADYVISGDEKITVLFLNHSDGKRTFTLTVNGEKAVKNLTVASAEASMKSVLNSIKNDDFSEEIASASDLVRIEEKTAESTAVESTAAEETGAAETEGTTAAEESSAAATEESAAEETSAAADTEESTTAAEESAAAEKAEESTTAAEETSAVVEAESTTAETTGATEEITEAAAAEEKTEAGEVEQKTLTLGSIRGLMAFDAFFRKASDSNVSADSDMEESWKQARKEAIREARENLESVAAECSTARYLQFTLAELTKFEKNSFLYSDENLTVTATVEDAAAVPADAELRVSPVTEDSNQYQAYMEALQSADNASQYSGENTKLYDIAFFAPDADGEMTELQLEKGAVTLKLSYKKEAIENGEALTVNAAEDLSVLHLPVKQEVKAAQEGVATTDLDITAEDITVEKLDVATDKVQLAEDNAGIAVASETEDSDTNATESAAAVQSVEFKTEGFSVFAVVCSSPEVKAQKISLDLEEILNQNEAYGYGVIASDYSWHGDTESNVMVDKYYSSAMDVGSSSNYSNAGGNNYIGEFDSNCDGIRFNSAPKNLYLGQKAYQTIEQWKKENKAQGLNGTSIIQKNIDVASKVDAITTAVETKISSDASVGKLVLGEECIIDLRALGAGVYQVNFDGTYFKASEFKNKLQIKIKKDQKLVINCTSTQDITIDEYEVNDKMSPAWNTDKDKENDWVTQAVIFYVPNANVNVNSSMGAFIVKNGIASVGNTSAGVLVAKTVAQTNGEWHYHDHELPEQGKINVRKIWVDDNDNAKQRPTSIDIQLYKQVEGTSDKTAEGSAVTLSEDNDWFHQWNNLATTEDGKAITYTVDETSTVTGYTKVVTGDAENGFVITNTYGEPGPKTTTAEIEVTKAVSPETWEWGSNSFEFVLKPDSSNTNAPMPSGASNGSVSGTATKDNKTVNFGEITYDTVGEYKYTITEVEPKNKIAGMSYDTNPHSVTVTVTDNGNGKLKADVKYDGNKKSLNITNTYVPTKISVQGIKNWDDCENQDGKRPTHLMLYLYADGKKTDKEKEISADEGWTYTFTDLDKYKDGKEIQYEVKEEEVKDYQGTVTTSSNIVDDRENLIYTLTNCHTPETVDVDVTKKWDGQVQESAEFTLYVDGKATDQKLVLTKDNDWKGSFGKLPKYQEGQEGKEIVYTVVETAVSHYEVSEKRTEKDGSIVYVFTNKYIPESVPESSTPEETTTPAETTTTAETTTVAPTTSPSGNGGGGGGGGRSYHSVTPVVETQPSVLGESRSAAQETEAESTVESPVPKVLGAIRKAVQTGEDSQIAVYAIAFFGCAAALGAWLLMERRRKEEE